MPDSDLSHRHLDCLATLLGNQLTVGNSRIARVFTWNEGHLGTQRLIDRANDRVWPRGSEARPDAKFTGEPDTPAHGRLTMLTIEATERAAAHLCVTAQTHLGSLQLRRVLRIYPDCPAIACDWFIRGRPRGAWRGGVLSDQDPLHRSHDSPASAPASRPWATVVADTLPLTHVHHRFAAVRFYDMTDFRNSLVEERRASAYRAALPMIGNLLFIEDTTNGATAFVLKESPCSDVQLAWPGFDFLAGGDGVRVIGMGLVPSDIHPTRWTRGYGCVIGVARNEPEALLALRQYQHLSRRLRPTRDHMVMLNTWGDRSQDRKVGEAFALEELDAGARLGVTHFQLDDGWQAGKSLNTALGGGIGVHVRRDPRFWSVHPRKFPNGLGPIMRRAKEVGIELGLWFEPTEHDSYADWRRNASTLIGLYHEHGIRTFKIDAVNIQDKRGETNLRALLDTVMDATAGQAVFNLDVTAGRRFGYHYFNEYGNKFLENRYTDWTNYYPHWTLRNLWQLSRYVPPQSLQVEWLNVWRNAQRYAAVNGAEDPLAPSRVPFAYAFAVTMVAQPLAWFEASGLPPEAFALAPLLRTYRQHQQSLHAGAIMPIGEEPSGRGWTGFQSVNGQRGYLVVYREFTEQSRATMRLWGLRGARLRMRCVIGDGGDQDLRVSRNGEATFALPQRWSFAMYRYEAG